MTTDAGSGPAIPEVIRRSTAYLERHGVESPRANVETLLMHLLGVDRVALYTRRVGLDTATAKALGRALCQRCTGIPLQHLTGEQVFFGLTLRVEPGVFVPRPETEVLVDAALAVLESGDAAGARGTGGPNVVDVGTGTGAIALAIAHARPDAHVYATDRDPHAVRLSRANARGLELGGVSVLEGDLLDPLTRDLEGRLDLIVSDPPYVRPDAYGDLPDDVRADPYEALVGGTDMHARLAASATTWLRPGAWLLVEIGDDQGTEVRSMLERAGLEGVEVLPDLTGRDRVVRGRRPAAAPQRRNVEANDRSAGAVGTT